MAKMRFYAVLLILFGLGLGYFDFASQAKHFAVLDKIHVAPREKLQKYALRLGLDLQGGTHLVYKADTEKLATSTQANPQSVSDSMEALRDVIDRRVNLFGVAEPLVQVEQASFLSDGGGKEQRLIVELPGLTDVDKAVAMIGATPVLEFKLERPPAERDVILKAQDEYRKAVEEARKSGAPEPTPSNPLLFQDVYAPTELTGKYLTKAELQFDNSVGGLHDPRVGITFNDEGRELFAKITRENVGKQLAIYLDGSPISAPVIREEITSGSAEISGSFKLEEAKQLIGRLNSGALPVPIELLSAQSIGATLGGEAYAAVVKAGIFGFLIVVCFMILWYRLPGLLAGISLSIYAALMIAIFKLLSVTMTSAGIAGFILSIGMAVDANILIFERMKEETKRGRALRDAMLEGFARAWTSIRDSNFSSIISAIILFWFGTSMVKGFALVLGIGVAVSMFTALTVTRTLLLSLGVAGEGKITKFLFGTGVKN
jgi:protein-export membrane protein SecD